MNATAAGAGGDFDGIGMESSPWSPSPGLDVADMVVLPPELFPPLPRESGRDGGDIGAADRLANTGAKFLAAFNGDL